MKHLVLFFPYKNISPLLHPYQDIERSEARQQGLIKSFQKHNIQIFMARGAASYISGNNFIPQYILEKANWIENTQKIEADLILGFQIPPEANKIFNTMREFTLDKRNLETLFPQHAILSYICYTYGEIEKSFSHIQSERKVLKPVFGTKGRGIKITKKIPQQESLRQEDFPYLLQEFFDTSRGFYEFPGIHDFRIIILAGKIVGKFLRQPQKGKYKANSYARGNFIDLEKWTLPEEVEKIISEIDAHFSHITHRYYSIDLGKGIDGVIKIFEFNSAPGLSTPRIGEILGDYITKNILKVG